MKLIKNKYKILIVKPTQYIYVLIGETIKMCQVQLTQGRMEWLAILNTVINLWFPYETQDSLTSCASSQQESYFTKIFGYSSRKNYNRFLHN